MSEGKRHQAVAKQARFPSIVDHHAKPGAILLDKSGKTAQIPGAQTGSMFDLHSHQSEIAFQD